MRHMEYSDRAIDALRVAERKLRSDLQAIMVEAVAAEAYADVASIARIADALSNLVPQFAHGDNGGGKEAAPQRSASGIKLFGAEWPDSVRATPAEQATMLQQRQARGSSRRDQYPRFLRDGDRLVKLAWSKKQRGPYEHRAPRAVVQALVKAIQKKKGEGKLFQASDVMPLKNDQYEEYPSYQSYLALNWLRDAGAVGKKGREGYVLKPNAATTEKLERLWTALPATESIEEHT